MPKVVDFLKAAGYDRNIPDHLAIHLTRQQRRAVDLAVTEGLTQAGVAMRMQLSQQRVGRILDRALAIFRGERERIAERVDLDDVLEYGPTRIVSKA